MTVVAIVGSRPQLDRYGRETPETRARHEAVRAYVRSLPADTVVITGGAEGVDAIAEAEARARGLEVRVYPADWKRYGKRAGAIRNREMVIAAERVVCFWDGSSPGSRITCDIARQMGKALEVIRP